MYNHVNYLKSVLLIFLLKFTVVGLHGARLVRVAQTVAVESSLNIENAKILSLGMVENIAAASREGPKCATRTLVQVNQFSIFLF